MEGQIVAAEAAAAPPKRVRAPRKPKEAVAEPEKLTEPVPVGQKAPAGHAVPGDEPPCAQKTPLSRGKKRDPSFSTRP